MNPVKSHFSMMKKVIMSPKTFFEGLNVNEGYKKVLMFTIVNLLLTLVVSFIFSALMVGNKGAGGLGMLIIGSILMIPFALVAIFIWTAVLHVVSKILGGKGTYNGSFLAIGYSTALMPFTAIPFIGLIIALYHLYIEIVGFRKIHQYSTARAVITVIFPTVVIFVVLVALIAVIGIALLGVITAGGLNPNNLQNLQNVESVQNVEQIIPQEIQEQIIQIDDSTSTYPSDYPAYDDSLNQ